MILKFNKCLNERKEYTLISLGLNDCIDNITADNFKDVKVYETGENYYYYVKEIEDIGNCEKFKIKVKKGDIVSLTSIDNSYVVFPSKISFAYAFNLDYGKVLKYTYKEVLLDGKPYEVKYVEDKIDKVNDGVVYTLSQLVTIVSSMIKSYNHRIVMKDKNIDGITNETGKRVKRIIMKYYDSTRMEVDKKFELNVKKVGLDNENNWHRETIINISKSNKYLYDCYILYMFALMILAKSEKDRESNNEAKYCFNEEFNDIDEVYAFLENHQDLVNNFFIETELLFTKPNSMYTSYAPHINGIYMFCIYNNIKVYLYRNCDEQHFNDKTLKSTYVSTHYKHKIRGIKVNYDI